MLVSGLKIEGFGISCMGNLPKSYVEAYSN